MTSGQARRELIVQPATDNIKKGLLLEGQTKNNLVFWLQSPIAW